MLQLDRQEALNKARLIISSGMHLRALSNLNALPEGATAPTLGEIEEEIVDAIIGEGVVPAWQLDTGVEGSVAFIMCNELDQHKDLLKRFVEDGPCSFDHHGYCQEHHGAQEPGDCPVAKARELLSA